MGKDQHIIDLIEQRKETLQSRVDFVRVLLKQEFAEHVDQFEQNLELTMKSNQSRKTKVMQLQKLMSDSRDISADLVACRKGCANCCHQLVVLSQTEADAIASRIGRPARQLMQTYHMPKEANFGRSTPCTFLENGECSIYDNRPFMCRNQVNLDFDNLLCSFENIDLQHAKDPRSTSIPVLYPGKLATAYAEVSGSVVYGDIRDFFSPQTSKGTD